MRKFEGITYQQVKVLNTKGHSKRQARIEAAKQFPDKKFGAFFKHQRGWSAEIAV